MTSIPLLLAFGANLSPAQAQDATEPPPTSWTAEQRHEILDRTLEIRLDPNLEALSGAEREALDHLIRVGELLQEIYLDSRHAQGLEALQNLESRPPSADRDELLDLFRSFNGPIATTLDNRRVPFLDVEDEVDGKNVYPPGLSTADLLAFLAKNPSLRDDILDPRSIVRRTQDGQLAADLETLDRHPALRLLHPGLVTRLKELARSPEPATYYAIPYSVAYADRLVPAYEELRAAARALVDEDPDFSAYLANRARDLLSDDYESGDASWITGSFGRLNAQIGSYETYDDQVQGVKTFFAVSLLVRDVERSRQLAEAIGGLQTIENSLPYEHQKKVRSDIPVGIYSVVADFGQSRGTNTATILPNDPSFARKYGRTILLRHNIMTQPELFAEDAARFRAAVVTSQADDLTLDSNFQRTLWHEIGHYLGVDTDSKGRPISESLGQYSDLLEEMKSDLVSLFAAPYLASVGYYEAAGVRSVYASGVLRTLQLVAPRRTQPYQTMQLMQMNYFLDHGLLTFDADGRLQIDYQRYPQVVESLLREVLSVQRSGDPARAASFVEAWGQWEDELHGVLAQRLREAQQYRYRRVRYAALGE